ncbi:MAG: hypothetical protein QXP86_01855 [Nitrososphaerota archaeon]
MNIASFRVDKKLKARMGRLRHINWSELLRRYVEPVVEQEENKLRPAGGGKDSRT